MRVADVGRYWCAYQWQDERPSKVAFEKCMALGHLGVHRTASPIKEPHTHWNVFVLGEDEPQVRRARIVCENLGGEAKEPEPGFIQALRRRRLQLAAQNIAAGRPVDTQIVHRDTRKVIDRDTGGFRDLSDDEPGGRNQPGGSAS